MGSVLMRLATDELRVPEKTRAEAAEDVVTLAKVRRQLREMGGK